MMNIVVNYLYNMMMSSIMNIILLFFIVVIIGIIMIITLTIARPSGLKLRPCLFLTS